MGNTALKNVHSFEYLGEKHQCDGSDEANVLHRMAIAQMTFGSLSNIRADHRLSHAVKLRTYQLAVCSTSTHSSEAWSDAQYQRLQQSMPACQLCSVPRAVNFISGISLISSATVLFTEITRSLKSCGTGHLRLQCITLRGNGTVITSVICKLLETIIRDHMMDFLVKHKLINPSQHGFLKARACLTNLLCFFEEITKWVDEGTRVDVIYLDFQKAFDKVPHQRQILKLKSHGMGNSIINWIEQWLTDRR